MHDEAAATGWLPLQDRALKKAKFDQQRYLRLQREVQRYSEMLQAQQRLQPQQQQQQQTQQ